MLRLAKIAAIVVLAFFLLSHWVGADLYNVTTLTSKNPKRTAYMGNQNRRVIQYWIPLSRISLNLRQAVITGEDGTFYQHNGIDYFEMKESLKRNFRDLSFSRGFSTITMQLARNLYLSPRKTIMRKFKEIIISFWMERELSKKRILELYLNVIEWGRGIYGVEAAARHYFNKSAAHLTLDESVFLATIIPSPTHMGRYPPAPSVQRKMNRLEYRMQRRWGRK